MATKKTTKKKTKKGARTAYLKASVRYLMHMKKKNGPTQKQQEARTRSVSNAVGMLDSYELTAVWKEAMKLVKGLK